MLYGSYNVCANIIMVSIESIFVLLIVIAVYIILTHKFGKLQINYYLDIYIYKLPLYSMM